MLEWDNTHLWICLLFLPIKPDSLSPQGRGQSKSEVYARIHIGAEGSPQLVFEAILPAKYRVHLIHRNHIAVYTAAPLYLGTEPVLIDFAAELSLFLEPQDAVQLSPGRFAFLAFAINR
jgi:hypothetical protein